MFEYTEKNYFSWGWNGKAFSPAKLGEQFYTQLDFREATRQPRSWREECVLSAKAIADSCNLPVAIGLSGGIDSQVAVLSFLEAGVDFRAFFVHYPIGKNAHDYVVAKRFCRKHGIQLEEHSCEVEKFYQERAVAICREVGTCSPRQILQSTFGDFYPDHCYVMAAGDMKPSLDPDKGFYIRMGATPVVQYQINRNLPAVTRFFMYSPQLLVAQLAHPLIQLTRKAAPALVGIRDNPVFDTEMYTHIAKPLLYTDAWGDALEQSIKFTGFERLERQRDILQMGGRNVLGAMGAALRKCKVEYWVDDILAAFEQRSVITAVSNDLFTMASDLVCAEAEAMEDDDASF